MTIVEFFDKEMLENIIGTLIYKPEKMVLFGKDYKKMSDFKERVQPILVRQNIQASISVISVNTNDYFAITETLEQIVADFSECAFDIIGGDETVLTAMGAVAHKHNIPLLFPNPRSGRIKKIMPQCGEEKTEFHVSLSVSDAVQLFDGTIISTTPETDKNIVFKLWDICKKDCGKWNIAMEQFSDFIPSADENPYFDGLTVRIPAYRLEEGLKNHSYRTESMDSILREIEKCRLLAISRTGKEYTYKFSSKDVLTILEKSGNVLELYVLHTVAALSQITDAKSGAVLDWENPPDEEYLNDVKNEIDVLATAGTTPIFISCKNGCVDSNELYKLNTVAQRFGGKYAKKILIMTYFDVPDSFIQRAQAMNIRVVRNIQELQHDAFLKKLQDNIK